MSVVLPATKTDASEIYRILCEAFRDSYIGYTIYQSAKAVKYLEEQIVLGHFQSSPSTYIIMDSGSVAGFYIAVKREKELFLNYIATSRSNRKRGFGRVLLTHFESRALEIGCMSAGLEVFESNTEAYEWYQREGYARRHKSYYLRARLAAFCGKHGPDLSFELPLLNQALLKEERDGFSSISCSIDNRAILLGFIAGKACKVLASEGLSFMEIARAICSSPLGHRRWLLMIASEPPDNLYGIESVDISIYLKKQIARK